eukprot:9017477-Alexandrium_andersonii.AAC.1
MGQRLAEGTLALPAVPLDLKQVPPWRERAEQMQPSPTLGPGTVFAFRAVCCARVAISNAKPRPQGAAWP